MVFPLYKKTELKNGLRIISEHIPYVRSIALGAWITVGSRDENELSNGISHFLEHMLFKGTRNRTTRQIAESLEIVGGSLDAFTTKEVTCYNAHILDEHLALSVDVLSDIMLNSLFDKNEMQKEKDVILKEIYQSNDAADDLIFDHFYQTIYDSHPLGYQIYGTESNIKSFTQKQLLDYMQETYAANRIVISAAGRVDHDELVSLVEKYYTDLPEMRERKLTSVPKTKSKSVQNFTNCSQSHVCFGMHGYSYVDPQKFPLLILNNLIGGGMSSLLFQKVREDLGLVYSIYSFYDFFLDDGLIGVYFSADPTNIDLILEVIRNELAAIKRDSISPDVLFNMKNQFKGELMLGLESTISRMNRLARNELYLGTYHTLDSVLHKIDEVTIDSVMQVADELFNDDNYFTTILSPK
ncbi:insulinase family protein [candidate division KSB1 bacterium]|nr:insulinase family protein [candidate division KSB1 bacterium]